MALYGIWLDRHDLDQGVESDISDVVISVRQELSQDVYTEYAKSRIGFDVKDCKYRFVQDGVANIFRGIGVGSNLGEDVVDLLTNLSVTTSQDS